MPRPDKKRIERHLKALVGERNPFTTPDRLDAVTDYVEAEFRALGLEPTREPVDFDGPTYHNILALQTPPGGEKAPLFVLGAHFDSVEGSPGADDNASAVAALLEIAYCLKDAPIRVAILFAGFTLEEYGFVGSQVTAERLRREGTELLGMVSLEMLGYRTNAPGSQKYPPYVDPSQFPDAGDFIAVVGNEPSQTLALNLADTLRRVPNLPVEHLVVPATGELFRDVRLSDHSPFWDKGFQAVMVTDTAYFRNPHYHQDSDTLETLDLDFIRDVSEGMVSYLLDLN